MRPLFDGSYGAALQQRGVYDGGCVELLNTTNPADIEALHADYAAAGATLCKTNTFGGTRAKLGKYDLGEKVAEMNRLGAQLARRGAAGAQIIGDIGPTGLILAPGGNTQPCRLIEIFAEQIRALCDAGVDGLLIETMFDLGEAKCALIAAAQVCPELPIYLSFTLERGRTQMGNPPEALVALAAAFDCQLIGTNCGGGPLQLAEPFANIHALSQGRCFAMPNAGLPSQVDGKTIFPLAPEEFAQTMRPFATAYALGGCCGTQPAHIAALAAWWKEMPAEAQLPDWHPVLCSPRQTATPDDMATAESLVLTGDLDDDLDELAGLDGPALLDARDTPAETLAELCIQMPTFTQCPVAFEIATPEQAQAIQINYAGVPGIRGPVQAAKGLIVL